MNSIPAISWQQNGQELTTTSSLQQKTTTQSTQISESAMQKFLRFLFHPISWIIFFAFVLFICLAIFGPQRCTNQKLDYDPNAPLFLTTFIRCGRVEQARQVAVVPPLLNVESFSGFITVDRNDERYLFFWYFPVEKSPEAHNAPVVLWLQGGPGESTMHGLFNQHGPFYLEKDGTLAKRTLRWSKNFHMIYIDSPVGTGFSFVKGNKYLSSVDQAAADLYEALEQIFQIFPELGEKDFFIAGESYAGKFIPALGRIIHHKNKVSPKIHLKGMLIGNGMIDSEFLTYVDFLLETKVIKTQDLPNWLEKEEQFKTALQQQNKMQTMMVFSEINQRIDQNISVNIYNHLEKTKRDQEKEGKILKDFLTKADVRISLHVAYIDFIPFNPDVNRIMFWGNFFNKISPYTEELLENYRILHYNGETDLVLHHQMARKYTDALKWSRSQEYQSAGTHQWKVNGNLAGSVRSGGNLTFVVVKNAGHSVPKDQPDWALELVTRFIRNQPLSS